MAKLILVFLVLSLSLSLYALLCTQVSLTQMQRVRRLIQTREHNAG